MECETAQESAVSSHAGDPTYPGGRTTPADVHKDSQQLGVRRVLSTWYFALWPPGTKTGHNASCDGLCFWQARATFLNFPLWIAKRV